MSASEGRRGLGRGLSALLDEAEAVATAPAPPPATSAAVDPRGAREIPIELIHANPDQPRRTFKEADLAELTDSIREKGVLQPILLRPAPGLAGEYQIVAGERRWRASQRAGVRALPAVVRELDDQQVLEIAIVENVQRADLDVLEEARAYKAVMERFGRTQETVAQAVGKSRSYIANAVRLLSLPDAVQAMLAEGELTTGHVRPLIGRDDALALAQQMHASGMTVRDAEALVRQADGAPKAKDASPRSFEPGKDADTHALEADLMAALGLKVELKASSAERGAVTISYITLEQLDDLCRRLMRAPPLRAGG